MTVSVVVPYRSNGCGYRERNWRWLRARWAERFPDWQIVECSDGDGPWRKGRAVSEGVSAASGELVVVADADVWTDGVVAAVQAVEDGSAPWAMPFDRLVRLTEAATDRAIEDIDLAVAGAERSSWAERPYRQRTAGGMVVLRRQDALAVPIDPRFAGFGGEDMAWRHALDTLVGRRVVLPGTLWHLWHPPQDRMSRAVGSRENERLLRCYERSRGRPGEMGELISQRAINA